MFVIVDLCLLFGKSNMSEINTIVVLTARGRTEILETGGSQAWRLNADRASKRSYVVCVQNQKPSWGTAEAEHHHAFLVGHVSSVTKTDGGKGERWIINIDSYADIDIADQWDGNRNPVSYRTLESMGINVDELDFKPTFRVKEKISSEPKPLTLDEAKKGLALTFRVKESDINITINA
jgi:hypothetical protein